MITRKNTGYGLMVIIKLEKVIRDEKPSIKMAFFDQFLAVF